ncbi:MAG: EAL domain-containing protein [Spirochaetia bacterium]|nr:EAL domain-containing protein [Spirochaetia bacterium]
MTERSENKKELLKKLEEREHEVALLKEISDAITSQLHLEDVFQMVADRAKALLNCETVLVPVLEKELDQYTYKAGAGKYADEIVGESLPLEFGVCGWVWKNKKAWWRGVLNELSEDEKNAWEKQVGTMILVPLIGKHHFLGGIAGMNKLNGSDFDERDLDLLTMFASQVSIAIENAQAYEKLEFAMIRSEKYQIELSKLNKELVIVNKDLEKLAHYDHLTNVPNRMMIQERLRNALVRAFQSKSVSSLLMVDLDHFKEINDTLGHYVGDELLKLVSHKLESILSPPDTIGRLGGDEFAIVLPVSSNEKALQVAEKIMKVFDESFDLFDQSFSISASVGIAHYPEHGTDVSALLKCADVALYVAKKVKSNYAVYNPKEDVHSTGRLALMSDLKNAIQNQSFTFYYQPKVDMQKSVITGVEALARWNHPQECIYMPDLFIPILEQTGLIRNFTAWAMKEILSQQKEWSLSGHDLDVSINLSMYNLRDPEFPEQVKSALDQWKPRPGSVTMEITESAVMGENPRIPGILEELSEVGIRFSIDDFGTGYSSLMLLKKLKVKELKIDKSFVMGMAKNKDDEVIVKSTIELGHNLGLSVVAEGVESKEVYNLLKEMKCEFSQGYCISPALHIDDFSSFMSSFISCETSKPKTKKKAT